MILVLFILLIPIIITILFLTSTLRIDVRRLKIINLSTNKAYRINIKLKFLNKIQWLSIKLNSEKIKRINRKIHLDEIDIKELESKFKFSDLKEFSKIKINVTNLKLKISIGLEDIFITTYLIAIISTVIAVILPHISKLEDVKNIKYIVEPLYNKGNISNIEINTGIEITIFSILKSLIGIYKNRKEAEQENKRIKNIRCNV